MHPADGGALGFAHQPAVWSASAGKPRAGHRCRWPSATTNPPATPPIRPAHDGSHEQAEQR